MPHERFSACIEACNRCAVTCDHCAVSCLQEPNVKEMADCIRLDMDCAQVCRFAAAMMSRGSQHARDVCRLCAGICEACGAECARHPAQHCQDCAKECQRCAEACRAMA